MNEDQSASRLVDALHAFNAKERNFLMRYVLRGEIYSQSSDPSGGDQSPDRWVHKNFLDSLKKANVIDKNPEPRCVYAAMDYHLDWLNAALWFFRNGKPVSSSPARESVAKRRCQSSEEPCAFDVTGTQEDVDLLLVFDTGKVPLVVLVEAKGASHFSSSQVDSKLTRLATILDPITENDTPVDFAFVLMGATDSASEKGSVLGHEFVKNAGVRNSDVLQKLRIHTLTMTNCPPDRFQVTRCDANGKTTKGVRPDQLTYWRIKRRPGVG